MSLLYFTGVTGNESVGLIVCIGLEGVGPLKLEGGKLAKKPVLALNFLMLDWLRLLYGATVCNKHVKGM